MTTIAWDGKALASDSQSQVGNMIISEDTQKIFNPSDGVNWLLNGEQINAIGVAGDTSCIDEVISKLSTDITYNTEFTPAVDFCFIGVTDDGKAYVLVKDKGDIFPSIFSAGNMFAVGSGDVYAMAAMKSGKPAKEAISVAISLDVYSGGEIKSYKILE